ncbi:GntR family transcriptional regulator [Clostridium formicaceticum]|uniref:GntR family transcriptional regulator n=1 Tax=Clostridium formicaceticum TaxID=1497 RepID=A0AAC9WHV6_9CLOT|nr:GntR family transcriptional regulator [Clostridium formicaceticum]AOY74945.1 GntR family transcriptional regulator [Clostridium formicaceticum]ARE89353.1 HTH-type transcriptional repressor YtrA [Clostridium formicaceticum]
MQIERKSGIPIYIQVKNHIIDDIKNGRLKIGEKLPTERELSQKLKVSRNTISTAYNLLEQEGVLISYQGRGTFVAEEGKTWKQYTTKNKVVRLIDIAIEEAIEMGLNIKEFIALVQDRVKEKELLIKNINAIFVECNIEQAKSFAKELSRVTDLNVVPMTVGELQNKSEAVEETINRTQIIITAFNHVNEVKDLIVDYKKDVFGIASNPNLETIVKIAKYPKKTKFGQISLSEEFYFKVQYALESAGLENLVMNATTSKDEKEVLKVIEESDVIIVSPGRGEEVKRLVGEQKDVIKFDYVLDQGSVKAILSRIMEIKSHL